MENSIKQDFLILLEQIGAKADVNVTSEESEDGIVVEIELSGNELGYMIGSRGRHLSALQYIFSMMCNKKYSQDDKRIYINIDVGGYKKEKYQKVEENALRRADDARILGDPVDLEPMSPSERRVVHSVLSKFDDIRTESFGEGNERYVRIYPISEEELGLTGKKNAEEPDDLETENENEE